MPLSTAIIAGIGAATAAIGTGVSIRQGQKATAAANEGSRRVQKENDRVRRLQDQRRRLAATRERRKATREFLIASATTRATATAQGVSLGSSPVQGADAQNVTNAGFNLTQVEQEAGIGEGISGATQSISDISSSTNRQVARFEQGAATGKGIASLGKRIATNAPEIKKISQSLFT